MESRIVLTGDQIHNALANHKNCAIPNLDLQEYWLAATKWHRDAFRYLEGQRSLTVMAHIVHANSVAHGFWDATEETPIKLMLMVDEISELHEHLRDGQPEGAWWYKDPTDQFSKPDGPVVELADLFIRGLDLAAHHGMALESVIGIKHAYNVTRPYLHSRKH